jgi:hypothetical protein
MVARMKAVSPDRFLGCLFLAFFYGEKQNPHLVIFAANDTVLG